MSEENPEPGASQEEEDNALLSEVPPLENLPIGPPPEGAVIQSVRDTEPGATGDGDEPRTEGSRWFAYIAVGVAFSAMIIGLGAGAYFVWFIFTRILT